MRWFRDYYSRSAMPAPFDFTGREFGFMFFDKDFVRRHVGFRSPEDLGRYLVSQVPMHVYYSSAHYENPSAPKMEQKGWRGADLVFDLDADHIPGADKMTYEEMLYVVKQDMIRLLDDFLLGDLGFAEEEVRITFSGGRGYHAHVQSDRVQRLGSHERSEVVDFVSGTDLDFEWIFKERSSMKKEYKTVTKVEMSTLIPPEGSGGWKGKVRKRLSELMSEVGALDFEEARAEVSGLRQVERQTVLLPATGAWCGPLRQERQAAHPGEQQSGVHHRCQRQGGFAAMREGHGPGRSGGPGGRAGDQGHKAPDTVARVVAWQDRNEGDIHEQGRPHRFRPVAGRLPFDLP